MHPSSLIRMAATAPYLLPIALVWAALFAAPTLPIASPSWSPADPEPTRVTLETEDKLKLAATYFPPCDAKEKANAALLVHDVDGSRADLQLLAKRLQKSGFAVLALDLRAHGESASEEQAWKRLDTEAQAGAWAAMQRDVKSGVDFLCSQGGVQSARVSLVAHGTGSLLIARHAVRDERVRNLVLIDPKTEYQGKSIVKDLEQLGALPTLLFVGKSDQVAGQKLAESAVQPGASAAWIEVKLSKQEAPAILTDKSMYGDISKWMLEKSTAPKPKN